MRKITLMPAIIFQLVIAFFTLYLIFILFHLIKAGSVRVESDDLDSKNYLSIYTILTIVLNMVICLLVGLPIRLVPKLNQWWTRMPVINEVMFIIGLGLLVFYRKSFFNFETIISNSGVSETYSLSNPYPVLTGWFLIGFSLLHLYPISFMKSDEKIISAKTASKHLPNNIGANVEQ